jgi:RNA polymerase sigma-70 factor (ECF subfamily)
MIEESQVAVLVSEAKAGRLQAFNMLVEEYQSPIYNLAYRMLSIMDTAAAEDIAQDTFVAAYRKLHQFKEGNFRAWLMKIAANFCRDYMRSAQVRRNVSLEALVEQPSFVVASNGTSPEDFTLRRELAEVLQATLMTLPEDQRLAVVLVDVQEFSYEESAKIMGIPVGTVKSRLSRGRLALRDRLLSQRELLPVEFRLR